MLDQPPQFPDRDAANPHRAADGVTRRGQPKEPPYFRLAAADSTNTTKVVG